jgi:hypothetical protein
MVLLLISKATRKIRAAAGVEKESYRLRNDLDENETYNMIRICFKNQFFISFDSYEGYYYFLKF